MEEVPDHFAPYEPAALKRLMGRYASRENEIDQMLRAGVFVDLYAVVRHSIRASVESYSIKKLEPLHDFCRAAPLAEAGKILAKVQACLELNDSDGIQHEDSGFDWLLLDTKNTRQMKCRPFWRNCKRCRQVPRVQSFDRPSMIWFAHKTASRYRCSDLLVLLAVQA